MGWKPFKKIIDNRHEKKMAKIEGRTERAAIRNEDNVILAEQGIDSSANKWKSVTDAATTLGSAAIGSAGSGGGQNSMDRPMGSGPSGAANNQMLMLGGAAILLFFLMGKKR
jgi:hypothetical protein